MRTASEAHIRKHTAGGGGLGLTVGNEMLTASLNISICSFVVDRSRKANSSNTDWPPKYPEVPIGANEKISVNRKRKREGSSQQRYD